MLWLIIFLVSLTLIMGIITGLSSDLDDSIALMFIFVFSLLIVTCQVLSTISQEKDIVNHYLSRNFNSEYREVVNDYIYVKSSHKSFWLGRDIYFNHRRLDKIINEYTNKE